MGNFTITSRNTRYHYRYVGRKDNGGIRKIRSVLPRKSLIQDPFISIRNVVKEMGFEEMLKKHFTETEYRLVLVHDNIVGTIHLLEAEEKTFFTVLETSDVAIMYESSFNRIRFSCEKDPLLGMILIPGISFLMSSTVLLSVTSSGMLPLWFSKNSGMFLDLSRTMPWFICSSSG